MIDGANDNDYFSTTTMDDIPQFDVGSRFEHVNSYSFSSDAEFRNGLAVILGHPGTPASEGELSSEDDLVLQAKCFYISRKKNIIPPLDFLAYKNWLVSRFDQTRRPTSQSQENKITTENDIRSQHVVISLDGIRTSSLPLVPENQQKVAEPVYPSSFAHIVELITTGQPIPGIQQISDTVLEGHEAPSRAILRRKPWENDDAERDAKAEK